MSHSDLDTTHNTYTNDNVALPLPPAKHHMEDMEVYGRFMRHLRCVPVPRVDVKILSAIQFTADITDHSDAHVSKVLVDLGLRAPRGAFPSDFLRFVDQSLLREGWDVGAPSQGLKALRLYWDQSGEIRKEGVGKPSIQLIEDQHWLS